MTRKFPAGNWGPGKQEKPGKIKGENHDFEPKDIIFCQFLRLIN